MKIIRNLIAMLILLLLPALSFPQKNAFQYYLSGSDGNVQILDQNGKPITNKTFQYAGSFSEGLCPVMQNDKFGFINTKGQLVIPYLFDNAAEFYNGVAIVNVKSKYGLINKKGKYVLSPELDDIQFSNVQMGLIAFKKDGLYGLMNKKGKVLIPNKFEHIDNFENEYVVVKSNKKAGLINTNGDTIIPFKYDYLSDVCDSAIVFSKNEYGSKLGLIDFNGNLLLKPEYDFICASKEHLFHLNKGNKKGLADIHGNIVLPTDYVFDFEQFNEGFMILEKNGKFGYANTKGEIAIPLIYDAAGRFSEGLAPVLKDGKWGFINAQGETVIDFTFIGLMTTFQNGYAAFVKRNRSSASYYTSDKWGLIDKNGNVVLQNKYTSAAAGYNGNFIVELNGKKLLINKNEEVIATLKSEEVEVFEQE